jgi:uncharacterized membrane protein YgcG
MSADARSATAKPGTSLRVSASANRNIPLHFAGAAIHHRTTAPTVVAFDLPATMRPALRGYWSRYWRGALVMFSRTCTVAANAMLSAVTLAYSLQASAGICEDLLAARMAATTASSAQQPSDAIDRAKADVVAAKARLDSAEAEVGQARVEADASKADFRLAAESLRRATQDMEYFRLSRPWSLASRPSNDPAWVQEADTRTRLEKALAAARTDADLARRAQEAAIERLNGARRARHSAQTAYDRAEAVLQQEAAAPSPAGSSAGDAEARVKQLEQQLEAAFRGQLHSVAAQAVDAQLQSTTRDECNERLARAETSYAQLKAFARANAVCLQAGHLQEISLVSDRARTVRAECSRLPAGTGRAGAGGGFESSGATTDVASRTAGAGISADPGNAQVRNVEAAINSCNFDRALASLNLYRPADPGDPWMAAKYQEVHEKRERVAAVQRLIAEMQGILASSASPDDLRQVLAMYRTASSIAPDCMSGAISGIRPVLDGAITASRQADNQRSRDAVARVLDSMSNVAQDISNRQRGGPEMPSGSAGAGGVQGSAAGASSSGAGGGGGGFESAGGSGSGGASGIAVTGGTSAGQPTAGAPPLPPRSPPQQPASQNTSGCRWVKEPGLLGNVSDLVECRCNGQRAPDSRCAGPRPQ